MYKVRVLVTVRERVRVVRRRVKIGVIVRVMMRIMARVEVVAGVMVLVRAIVMLHGTRNTESNMTRKTESKGIAGGT